MTSRDWCFTSFAIDAMEKFKDSVEQNTAVKYAVLQKEVCPDTARPHYQGYIVLHKPSRMSGVKKVLGDASAHLEKRKGTHAEVRHSRAEPCCALCPHFLNPYNLQAPAGY